MDDENNAQCHGVTSTGGVDQEFGSLLDEDESTAARNEPRDADRTHRGTTGFRFSIPLFFFRCDLVIYRRKEMAHGASTLGADRLATTAQKLTNFLADALAILVLLCVGIGLFMVLYFIKRAAGIDLFPGFHLFEFLPNVSQLGGL